MAEAKIPFDVALKRNDNQYNSAYGKYYPVAYNSKTLSLKGLIERVAFEQSVYSRDIIEGVIQRLTKVMVELLQSAQPVKWDGLGTFIPTIEAVNGGCTAEDIKAGKANIDQLTEGIHIRMVPENAKGEELTSKKFKDTCVLNCVGILEVTKVKENGKTKRFSKLVPLDTWRKDNATTPEP